MSRPRATTEESARRFHRHHRGPVLHLRLRHLAERHADSVPASWPASSTRRQALLVTFAFYMAYFFLALPSSCILKQTGFKKGMSLGLLIMALGALVFIPAALTPHLRAVPDRPVRAGHGAGPVADGVQPLHLGRRPHRVGGPADQHHGDLQQGGGRAEPADPERHRAGGGQRRSRRRSRPRGDAGVRDAAAARSCRTG